MQKVVQKDERRQQLAEFLRSRRARLTPSDVGLPNSGRRRTPGLRREEVAQMAGVGVDWYTWLEQGRNINASEQVLSSIARILRLDQAETRYLFTLAYGNGTNPYAESVSPVLQFLLDNLTNAPAIIMNRYWDILAWNRAYYALYGNIGEVPQAERNLMWLAFGSLPLRDMLQDWETHLQVSVAQFRADYGANTGDTRYEAIIERLLETSAEFREWWPRHDVRGREKMHKIYEHPLVGTLTMEQNTFQMSEAPELRMVVVIPVPNTPTLERLQALIRHS
jgi:transcriptional regulator with XRE-family HTH domain